MFLAEMQTENYTFRALGVDIDAARRAIHRGWKKHCKQTAATGMTLGGLQDHYGINVYPMEMNECLRDDDILKVQ